VCDEGRSLYLNRFIHAAILAARPAGGRAHPPKG